MSTGPSDRREHGDDADHAAGAHRKEGPGEQPVERPRDPRPGEGPDATPAPPAPPVRRPVPVTQHLGRLVLGALVVLFVVFAVSNAHHVDFRWVFGASEVVEVGGERVRGGVPLIVLLLGSFLLGGLVGALVEWQVLRTRFRPRSAAGRPDDRRKRRR